MASGPIKLILINGRVLTFSADDYITLRRDYRITGKLIGVAVPYPRNTDMKNLPAIFTDYETKLMLDEKIAILEEKCDLTKEPTDESKKAYESYQNEVTNELGKPYIDAKMRTVKINMAHVIEGRRKKLIASGIPEERKKKTSPLSIKNL
jgi:hypothetical protein